MNLKRFHEDILQQIPNALFIYSFIEFPNYHHLPVWCTESSRLSCLRAQLE